MAGSEIFPLLRLDQSPRDTLGRTRAPRPGLPDVRSGWLDVACRVSRLDLRTSIAPTASWAGVGDYDARAGHPKEALGDVESAQRSREAEVEARRAHGQDASAQRGPASGRRNRSKIQSVPRPRRVAFSPPTRRERFRDRRFKKKNPDSQDAETIGAFQQRDPASISSFSTIVRCSFSCTAARGGALLRSRETPRRYERETPPPARRDDVRAPF